MSVRNKLIYGVLVLPIVGCSPGVIKPDDQARFEGEEFNLQIETEREADEYDASVPPPESLVINKKSGVISGTLSEPGLFEISISASNSFGSSNSSFALDVKERPKPHDVKFDRELLISDTDNLRQPDLMGIDGVLNIRNVLKRIIDNDSDEALEAFASNWFSQWEQDQEIENGNSAPEREDAKEQLASAWRTNSFEILAVVNRIDLTRFESNQFDKPIALGEGRIVYQVPGRPFTIIFEYQLPGEPNDLTEWAFLWNSLSEPGISSAEFRRRLANIVSRFSAAGALSQVRTNHLFGPWELREFHLVDGQLVIAPTALTPDKSLNDTDVLKAYLEENIGEIELGGHEVPEEMLAANVPVGGGWRASGVLDRAVRIFSFNTCDGCHQFPEVQGVPFQHIRGAGTSTVLSQFLEGDVELRFDLPGHDDGDGKTVHNERESRMQFTEMILNPLDRAAKSSEKIARDTAVRKIIKERAGRIH